MLSLILTACIQLQSLCNSQTSVTQKEKLPILNSGRLKRFKSYDYSLLRFLRFLHLESKATASADMEAQLTTVVKEVCFLPIGEPEAIFLCRHTASTLLTWVSNSFLKWQFLLLLTYDTKIWTNCSTKRIHILLATERRDDTAGLATEENSILCYFCATQPQDSYHLCQPLVVNDFMDPNLVLDQNPFIAQVNTYTNTIVTRPNQLWIRGFANAS